MASCRGVYISFTLHSYHELHELPRQQNLHQSQPHALGICLFGMPLPVYKHRLLEHVSCASINCKLMPARAILQ